jgi:protein-S-isoprenylcysteine O-methyltransferase Ste14
LTGPDLAAKTALYGVMTCWWLFALTFWLRKSPPRAGVAKRKPLSYVGLLLQSAAYFMVWFAPLRHKEFLAFLQNRQFSWVLVAIALAIAGGSVILVNAAARKLGKQWSLGAQLVEGHSLIQDGPYRYVRNPIYTGMLGMLIATGLVTTRCSLLALAVVLFMVGTSVRIRSEESLLRGAFGKEFDNYASRVRALIPGIY